ncbi:uncharacterized protein TrAFT101_010899 [Trichoderma asperellum]|uniref:Uncharacterized protein n=1 Tax=Trichoderma asperellum (strain ATCC 204424 / CBS 433.97 / NBRC 101777) TaxID=1042311 RepID=A0A2T3YX76_TRIA4|nr:hypothetical protein M441DRAFT_61185 [Trichoderma asperellum CBS 433.97]PTB37165.1 hypothetical protein M441DRAFT_61185 [Trichoderma asperellum CBS 433.97]UKZ96097.1 hypothetical protein TrAFT101_010899 [Trichoderma asperellum]
MSGPIAEILEVAGKEAEAEGVLLGKGAAEGVEIAGESVMSEAKLMEEVEQLAIKEAPESLVKNTEVEISASLKEGSEMVMAEAKAGGTLKTLADKLKSVSKYMWDNKGAFAKMMGAEVAKGAFFTLGMIAVEKIFAAKQQKNPTPEGQHRLDIVRAINKERLTSNPIIKQWRTWLADHFEDRATFGAISVEGTEIQRFQILQNRISEAQHFSDDTVVKATEALKAAPGNDSAKELLTKEIEWMGKLKAISDEIKTKESLMVAAGLKDRGDDLDKAKKLLEDQNK